MMNKLRDSIAHRAMAAAFLLSAGLTLGAQDAAGAGSSDDDLFGAEETVVQAASSSKEAEGKSEFLKYDQVKVGGSFTGTLGLDALWGSAWDGSDKLFDPSDYYLAPAVSGKVTLVAKPSTDFGVNMDFRTSWPFTSVKTLGAGTSGSLDNSLTQDTDESKAKLSIPNISVWSLYSKFNWQDRIYFSFGKQPLSWGVSKGYFQPADDIFAVSSAIDPTDTGAEREGPISLKTTVPLGVTNNFYFYAGLPTDSDGSTKVEVQDARFAAKAEFSFGNTEAAVGAYYAYNDHPRLLVMGTTGLGQWNLYGEGVLKYGSERYFIEEDSSVSLLGLSASQESGKFYFTGVGGGYYTDSDSGFTVALAYMYNGEAQSGISAAEAFKYYTVYSDQIDRMGFGAHNVFASVSDSKVLPGVFGDERLSASLIAIADLSDLSAMVMPSLSYKFFDYMSLKVGGTFTLGAQASDYYRVLGSDAALSLTLTVGTGSF
jgi:hypothetical protein